MTRRLVPAVCTFCVVLWTGLALGCATNPVSGKRRGTSTLSSGDSFKRVIGGQGR
jgi:hypothetical protein